MNNYYKFSQTPVGNLQLICNDEYLLAILWEQEKRSELNLPEKMQENNLHPVLKETEQQLQLYFKGTHKKFSLPIHFAGTAFQEKVWRKLCTIPFGTTFSYAEVAQAIGHPKAVRAVGTAIGRNPLSIVIPCHRVIGANGALRGFAGGLDVKQFLLELEGMKGLLHK